MIISSINSIIIPVTNLIIISTTAIITIIVIIITNTGTRSIGNNSIIVFIVINGLKLSVIYRDMFYPEMAFAQEQLTIDLITIREKYFAMLLLNRRSDTDR